MYLISSLIVFFISQATLAATYDYEESEGLDYDSLVRKLSQNEKNSTDPDYDPFANVKIHAGVGFANSVYTVNHTNGDKTYAAGRGVQVALGIDLFSRNWLAEGTFRNYGESRFENATISLKEFDLKLLYQSRFSQLWSLRFGAGLAARYMDISYTGKSTKYAKSYDTPASVLQTGLFTHLSQAITIGADASVRNAMIEESPDRSSYDLTLRLDGHF